MNHTELRVTPSKTPDYTIEKFTEWLDIVNADSIICTLENKDYDTKASVTPHFHLYFKSEIQQNSIRTSFKKAFPDAKGNASFKFGKVRDVDDYLLYMSKWNQPVYLRGYTAKQIEEYSNTFKANRVKDKKTKGKKTKVQKVKEYLQSKDIPIYASPNLIYHILEYHFTKGCCWTEYELKKIYTYLTYESKSDDQRKAYANSLYYNFQHE